MSLPITDERLRWLSSPDYLSSESGRLAAELLAARARIAELEADALRANQLANALQVIGHELSLHDAEGPAGEAFRSCLRPTIDGVNGESK